MIEKLKSNMKTKSFSKIIIAIGIVVAIAILIGLGIYNSPVNRLKRQLDLGQKYLEEQNYEQAVIAFNKAIEIDDRCLEAYVGGIEAYLQMGNTEELTVFYESALEVVRSISKEECQKNSDAICTIYSAAYEVYDDWDKALEILQEAYTKLEGMPEAEIIKEKLSKILKDYLDKLIKEKKFEEIKALIEKYKGIEANLDSYIDLIEKAEKEEQEKVAFFGDIFEWMKEGKYSSLTDWTYKKEIATPFVNNMESDYCVYIPEDSSGLNGMGVGVYKFGIETDRGPAYYFYYGNYENGVRKGEGITLYNNGDAMTVLFYGNWENDAPNGEGMEVLYGPNSDVYVSGNLVNGLWDGEVSHYCDNWFEGITHTITYTAINGIPTEDKTAEYISLYPQENKKTGMITLNYDLYLDEDEYIYAYDQKYHLFIRKDAKIGVLGYGTQWEEWEYGD